MYYVEENTSRVLCGSAARTDCHVPLTSIGYAMEGDRPLQVRGSLPAVEDTLRGNRDVVVVVNLVVNKVSIDTAIKRWAPVVCVVRFIYSGCWSNASSVDNFTPFQQ